MPDALAERLRRAGCVYAEDEAALLREAAADGTELEQLVLRREAGEPLEVVVGWAELCGRRVLLDPGVFVPRRRTELLALTALALLDAAAPSPRTVVVDLCCGSGAVAAVLAAAYADLDLHAVDVDPRAVACARRNLPPPAQVHEGDLDAALPPRLRGRIDVITANAPYVPTDELAHLPRESREHEPRVTVDGGTDGVALHRRIAAVAAEWLTPAGTLLLETSPASLPRTLAVVREARLSTRLVEDHELEAVVVVATRPGPRDQM